MAKMASASAKKQYQRLRIALMAAIFLRK